jgi:hypothetical protein
MRPIVALIIACLFAYPANAAYYNLPLNGVVTVLGDLNDKFIEVDITFIATASLPPPPADGFNVSAFTASTSVNGVGFSSTATNQIGGGCHYPSCFGHSIFLSGSGPDPASWFNKLYISTSFSIFGPGIENPHIELGVNLPDGYWIAAPVPEPSTWAMLLIGFAGLGFAGSAKQLLTRRAFGIKSQ